jgi:hypothetical protein
MSRPGSGVLVAFLMAAVLWLPASASAQNVTGTILGTIVDEQGQVVPGATVTVINRTPANRATSSATRAATFRSPRCRQARTP